MKSRAASLRAAVKKELKELRPVNFLFLTAAGLVNAFGVTMFLYPVKL